MRLKHWLFLIGVVYSLNTGRVRKIIKPDTDAELNNILLASCEGEINLPDSSFGPGPLPDGDNIQNQTTLATGLIPQHDHFVTIDSNSVVSASFTADPACDPSPNGKEMIQDDTADLGDTYDRPAKKFKLRKDKADKLNGVNKDTTPHPAQGVGQ